MKHAVQIVRLRIVGRGLLIGVALLCLSCAGILMQNVEIRGRVQLKGQGSSGHGGVLVRVPGGESTYSDASGAFKLTGETYGTEEFDVEFSKDGYESAILHVTVPLDNDERETVVVKTETVTLVPT